MEKFKKVILVLGPIVLIVGIWWTLSNSKPPIPDSVQFVNVVTGERVNVSRSRIGDIPGLDAEGRPALYPIYEDTPGKFKVDSFFAPSLAEAIKTKKLDASSLKINPKTLEVP